MFGRKLVRESEINDYDFLEQQVVQLTAEKRELISERDDLVEMNKKLANEREDLLKQIVDLGTGTTGVNAAMLEALKLAEPYMKTYIMPKGKADYSVVANAIKAGEGQ